MANESARKAAERSIWNLFKHKDGCLWATELPTGGGNFFGCTCGLDKLLCDLEDYDLSAACQTVAPPLSLLTRLRVAGGNLRMNLKDAATMYPEHFNIPGLEQLLAEYEAINAEVVAFECGASPAVSTPLPEPNSLSMQKRKHVMSGGKMADFKPEPVTAVSTPRCPKCGNHAEFHILHNFITCWNSECKYSSRFAQFFQPAPAQPRKPGNVIALEVAMRLCREGLVDVAETGLVASAIFEYCFPDEFKELNPPAPSPQGERK